MEQQNDQRAHRRYQVQTGVGAALCETKIGTITTISRGGVTLSYIDISEKAEKSRSGPSDSVELSIIHDDGFSLNNVPCKILEQGCSPSQNYFGTLNMYQCHLQFGQLTKEQKSQLEYFFDYFTDRPITRQ